MVEFEDVYPEDCIYIFGRNEKCYLILLRKRIRFSMLFYSIMQFSLLPSLPSRHLLLLKVCIGNLQFLPLNLDYENDNLISSVSSESYTPLPRLSFSPIL